MERAVGAPRSWSSGAETARSCPWPPAWPTARGDQARLLRDLHEGANDTTGLLKALQRLRAQLDDAPVTLIWDHLSCHKSRAVRAWLGAQSDWLQVAYLAAYAPEPTPPEGLCFLPRLDERSIRWKRGWAECVVRSRRTSWHG